MILNDVATGSPNEESRLAGVSKGVRPAIGHVYVADAFEVLAKLNSALAEKK